MSEPCKHEWVYGPMNRLRVECKCCFKSREAFLEHELLERIEEIENLESEVARLEKELAIAKQEAIQNLPLDD